MYRFDEYWIGPPQLALTAALARSTNGLDGEVVEVGTWQGLSAIPIARAVDPSTLHVVDHWLGDSAPGIDPELVKRDNYGIFLRNVEESRLANIHVWKMGWREFAERWDKPIRFLHIDATHSADEVSENIAALLPYASEGTIFCGDDYGFPEVAEGVHRQFDWTEVNSSENKLWWHTIGAEKSGLAYAAHGHPLAASRNYQADLMHIRDLFTVRSAAATTA